MSPRPPPPDVFAFAVDPSLAEWDVSPQEWMRAHDKHWDGLAVATVVFDGDAQGERGEKGASQEVRVLLLQRAAHDSMPNRWEVPGGAADEEDESLLRAAARELWEEAGLVAQRYTHLVPQPRPSASTGTSDVHDDSRGCVFTNRTGARVFCRFAFHADVGLGQQSVVLDPDEHQAFVWATESEVRAQQLSSGQAIPITTPATVSLILEAFRLRHEK